MIKTKRNVKIPYSEQYETRDFLPKVDKSLQNKSLKNNNSSMYFYDIYI